MEQMETDPDDDSDRKSEAFLAWLTRNGATISPKIRLADLRDQNAGRGVVAIEDLADDEELFSIPRSSILTPNTSSLPASIQNTIKEGFDDPWLQLILTMVLEHLQGSESSWKPYFDVLPTHFDSLMFWSDAELEHLEGSAVVHKIGKAGADTMFQEQLIPTIRQASASLHTTPLPSNHDLLALCHRMGSTIMAYAFDLENPAPASPPAPDGWEEASTSSSSATQPKGMVPLADMLNADAHRNNAKLFYEDDTVVMKTVAPVPAGAQLFNDFGALPRADLLRRYGYVTPNYAAYDVADVPTALIQRQAQATGARLSAAEVQARCAYVDEHGLLEDGYDVARADSEDGAFPEELCVLVAVLVMGQAEFEKLRKREKLPKAELTDEARALLRSVLVHRFAAYPAADAVASAQEPGEPGSRRRMAWEVVEGEKQVLREAVEALSTKVAGAKKRTADTLDEEAASIRQPAKRGDTR